ncbi:hypothetical protein V6N12_023722 [Hibiscus sabdariffa]|uniref:Uncharacterized protein n=1 Tax=Hibiscus sabdariffa TaxID=183260 RepID=A0ABR2FYI9_9ROSI
MDRDKIEGELSSSLIVKEKPRDGVGHGNSATSMVVVLSTFVAVFGSYVFWTAAIFSVWFNIDDRSNDRCSNEWENSRLRWSNSCSFATQLTFAIIGTIPCLMKLLGLFFIPESPRWQAKIGKWKECEASLQRLRGDNADISDEADEIIKEYAWSLSLTVGVGLMVLQQVGGINGIAFYASSIFESAAMVVVHVSSSWLALPSEFIYIILINVFLNDRKNLQYVPTTALGVILLDKSG